jgi:hypothetical protein
MAREIKRLQTDFVVRMSPEFLAMLEHREHMLREDVSKNPNWIMEWDALCRRITGCVGAVMSRKIALNTSLMAEAALVSHLSMLDLLEREKK